MAWRGWEIDEAPQEYGPSDVRVAYPLPQNPPAESGLYPIAAGKDPAEDAKHEDWRHGVQDYVRWEGIQPIVRYLMEVFMQGHNCSSADMSGGWLRPAGPHVRRHDRMVVTAAPATLLVKSESQLVAYPVHLVDVTEQGIRIKAGIPLKPGEMVMIMPREGPRYAVNSRVVWARREGYGLELEMGFEFQNPVPTSCWGLAPRLEEDWLLRP